MDKKIVPETVRIKVLKKLLVPGTVIFMSLSLTACAGTGKAGGAENGTAAGQEKSEISGSETAEESQISGMKSEETRADAPVKQEETEGESKETGAETEAQEGLLQENAGMANPVRQVDSSSAFEAIGLKLELPANDQWYSEPLYSVIEGRVAQIQFVDKITDSDAIARAGKSGEEDISGIYYVFDDSKKQSWFTKMEDGTLVDITVQVTEENSDVHGVLATWNYKDVTYSLWEDDAWEYPDAVAKMAIAIMERSGPEEE